jgi:hypothetical protein
MHRLDNLKRHTPHHTDQSKSSRSGNESFLTYFYFRSHPYVTLQLSQTYELSSKKQFQIAKYPNLELFKFYVIKLFHKNL